MPSRIAQNEGALNELTFDNLSTTVAASLSRAITQTDIDAGRNAVSLIGNKQVAICTTTRALFGEAIAVSEDLNSKGNPNKVVVRVAGVLSLNGTTTLPTVASFVSARGGKVAAISGTTLRGTLNAKKIPTVIEVWNTDKIEVLM